MWVNAGYESLLLTMLAIVCALGLIVELRAVAWRVRAWVFEGGVLCLT